MTDDEKKQQLENLAAKIDATPEWWRFPTEPVVQGFLGAGPIFLVGDQPSTSEWPINHPNRRAFYDMLTRLGIANAHITDLYKKRGKSNTLGQDKALPADFQSHLEFFSREVEILQPEKILAMGSLAYKLLSTHVPEQKKITIQVWHFSYAVRYGKLVEYETDLRRIITGDGWL